jgi:hypothetical protein
VIIHWKQIYSNGNVISNHTILKSLLTVGGQVLFSYSEAGLQKAFCTLHNSTKQFGMNMSALKSKVLAFNDRLQSEVKL